MGHRIAGNKEFGVDVVQIPLEAFALEIVTGWEKKGFFWVILYILK